MDRAVEHRVADDDRLFGTILAVFRRPHDQPSAAQALADIVVAVADQVEGDAIGEKRAEGLAGRAAQRHADRLVGQALVAVALGDLARQHRAGRPVRVVDRHVDAHGLLRSSAGIASAISLRSRMSSIGCFWRSVQWISLFSASGL
jgi:hypothetical protein